MAIYIENFEDLVESIKRYDDPEEWIYNYPIDIDSDGYSYFQDAAIEIAMIAYSLGKKYADNMWLLLR